MGNSAHRLRPLLLPATVAVLWILPALARNLLLASGPLAGASSLVTLVFPDTLPERLRYVLDGTGFTVVAGLAALAVAAFSAVLLPSAGRDAGASRRTAFLAGWACIILASVAGSAVLGAGLVLAEWPPARKIYLFESLTPLLLAGAYWGVAWGWLPALLSAGSAGRRRSPALPGSPARPQREGSFARPWFGPLGVFTAASVALLILSPMLAAAPQAMTEPEVVPTQEPVVYGAEPVGPSLAPPDPQWCTGEEVLAGVDGWDAATGHRGARLTVTNTGDRACVVQDYPDLAFENTEGWVMNITAVHGGSFMTQDTAAGPVILEPGQAASAEIGWNGTAGAGMARVGTLLLAPFAGSLRQDLEVDIDLTEPGFLTVTRWTAAESQSPG
ncbi:DUF4232 domain-containing protein [Arthrobacter sp. ATA002]|uniref:DUF4232 domain-containing protein n=1 Tax=Arthrobacter sp. ATA002 TaxID=2991715 RepID=UPI0022A7F367|nr:DUF4232 domain-containing protein [Arthrobacter sp. ATA002]WAP50643.1 DUF4232 domain-containing protein [Arthrobacter sp. ATA002]